MKSNWAYVYAGILLAILDRDFWHSTCTFGCAYSMAGGQTTVLPIGAEVLKGVVCGHRECRFAGRRGLLVERVARQSIGTENAALINYEWHAADADETRSNALFTEGD